MNTKSQLRASMLAKRAALTPEETQTASRAVLSRLRELPVWKSAREALLYLPIKNEIDPGPLFEELWARGARTLLPRCRKAHPGLLDLACVDSLAQTCPGSFGVLEPHEELCRPPDAFSPDLILVPGAVFDRSGRRIGFGGGYYDRLLSRPDMQKAAAIGLAHSFQLVESLQADPWDRPVHGLCTDKETLWMTK